MLHPSRVLADTDSATRHWEMRPWLFDAVARKGRRSLGATVGVGTKHEISAGGSTDVLSLGVLLVPEEVPFDEGRSVCGDGSRTGQGQC